MPLLIRGFGVRDYGLYILAGSVGAYASLLDLGVGTSLAKMVAEASATDDAARTRSSRRPRSPSTSSIGLLAATIIAIVAFNAGAIFRVNADGARLLRNLLLISAVSSLWAWPANTAGAVLAGRQRYVLSAKTATAAIIANIGVTIAVLVTDNGPVVLMAGSALVALVASTTNAYLAWNELGRGRISPLDSEREVMRTILGFSWAVFVIQVCTLVIYQQTDRLVLGVFLGAASITLYEAAGKFLGLVTQAVTFTNSAVLPMASNLDAAGRNDMLEGLVYRGTRYVVAFIAPAVLIVMILARPIITGWLGPAFASQATNAAILVSPWLLLVTTTMADNVLITKRLLPKRIPWVVAFTVENLVLSVILVQTMGIRGVVLGTAIPYLLDYPFHMALLAKHGIVSWEGLLRRVVLPTYPFLIIPGTIAGVALVTPLVNSLLGTAVVAGIAYVGYWAAFLARNDPERQDFIAAARGTAARLGYRGE